jgi:hypothetical protein
MRLHAMLSKIGDNRKRRLDDIVSRPLLRYVPCEFLIILLNFSP